MLGGARRADRVIPLNLSEWVTLFRVGVATESEPWTEADSHFAAICWATGVISSNEERHGNPYGPPDLLARRPESERAAICQVLKVTQLKYKCSGNHLVEVASGSRWHKTTKGRVKADYGMLV